MLFKRVLGTCIVILLLICLFFTMSAALDNRTIATERPYLLQGQTLLVSMGSLLAACAVLAAAMLAAIAEPMKDGHAETAAQPVPVPSGYDLPLKGCAANSRAANMPDVSAASRKSHLVITATE